MSTPSAEREFFTIVWKIKNFSYCWIVIRSPEFIWEGRQFWLELNPNNLQCKISGTSTWIARNMEGRISFLTCDGSTEEYSSEKREGYLTVSSSKHTIFGQRRNAFLPKDTLTVTCQIQNQRQPSRGKVYMNSTIGVKRRCFLWTNIDEKICIEKSDLYGSIQLKICSSGGINSDEQFYIEVSRRDGETCYSVLKISVLDFDEKVVNYVSDEFVFEKKEIQQVWRFPPFIRKKALQTLSRPISLKCDFAVTLGKVTDETAVFSYSGDRIPLLENFKDPSKCFESEGVLKSTTDLETDLKTMLDNGILSDVSLKIGSEVIQAHRNILSVRSTFFKAMFTDDTKETTSKTVVIETLNVETLRRMLLYMYTDDINNYQWENILNLYFAAGKYEVLSLKEKCSSFLKENLSSSNVCEVLILADLHQDQGLLSNVNDFLSKYNSEVFASNTWKELEKSNPSLALKTLREIKSLK